MKKDEKPFLIVSGGTAVLLSCHKNMREAKSEAKKQAAIWQQNMIIFEKQTVVGFSEDPEQRRKDAGL